MTTNSFRTACVAGLTGAALISSSVPDAAAQDYYKGKTLTIYIGFEPGGSYDYYGRLLARHIGKHLPGAPTVVASSMPGAGGLRAANYLFAAAPKDGTAIGIVTQTLPLEELLGNAAVKYKTVDFNWIGRVTDVAGIMMSWHTSQSKTPADLARRETPIATTGPGSVTFGFPVLLNALGNTRFKVVSGYQGAAAGMLAMERGETEASTTDWNTLRTAKADWLRDKKVNLLMLYAGSRIKERPEVPYAAEFATNADGRQILALYASGQDVIGRSFLAPPAMPAARVAELRQAFNRAMADLELKAEIDKSTADFNPVAGEVLQQQVAALTKAPPALVSRMKELLTVK